MSSNLYIVDNSSPMSSGDNSLFTEYFFVKISNLPSFDPKVFQGWSQCCFLTTTAPQPKPYSFYRRGIRLWLRCSSNFFSAFFRSKSLSGLKPVLSSPPQHLQNVFCSKCKLLQNVTFQVSQVLGGINVQRKSQWNIDWKSWRRTLVFGRLINFLVMDATSSSKLILGVPLYIDLVCHVVAGSGFVLSTSTLL